MPSFQQLKISCYTLSSIVLLLKILKQLSPFSITSSSPEGTTILSLFGTLMIVAVRLERIHATLGALSVVILPATISASSETTS